VLSQEGFSTRHFQPIGQQQVHLSALEFFDDTDIIQTYPYHNDTSGSLSVGQINTLFNITQSALDLLSGSLGSTGGDLEDSKTFILTLFMIGKDLYILQSKLMIIIIFMTGQMFLLKRKNQ
jgi:hypothetical protein